jgi:hypothetical protein
MRRRLWSWLKPETGEPCILGAAGEGKVLVTSRRDWDGSSLEQVWCTPETAADWEERRWRPSWR